MDGESIYRSISTGQGSRLDVMLFNELSNEVFGFLARDRDAVDRVKIQNFLDRINKVEFLLFVLGPRPFVGDLSRISWSGKFRVGVASWMYFWANS